MGNQVGSSKRRKRAWTLGEKWLGAGIAAATGLVVWGVIVARLPAFVIPTPQPPTPNGYDVFVQASSMAPAISGLVGLRTNVRLRPALVVSPIRPAAALTSSGGLSPAIGLCDRAGWRTGASRYRQGLQYFAALRRWRRRNDRFARARGILRVGHSALLATVRPSHGQPQEYLCRWLSGGLDRSV